MVASFNRVIFNFLMYVEHSLVQEPVTAENCSLKNQVALKMLDQEPGSAKNARSGSG
jgi:hypothetical protein